MTHGEWHRSGIGRQLLFYILLCSSLITLVLTAVQLLRDYRIDVSQIDARIKQVELASLASIRESLWHLDLGTLQLQLEGIERLPDIARVVVLDTQGQPVAQAGNDVAPNYALKQSYRIIQPFDGKAVELGRLSVTASLQGVQNRLWDKAIVILASQAVKTFLVSMFIMFIVYRLVTRHLIHLAEYSRDLDPVSDTGPLEFERADDGRDELDTVAASINILRQNLATSLKETHASAERFQKVFEGSLDAIMVIECDSGRIVDCNSRTGQLLDNDKQDLVGRTFADLYDEDHRSADRFIGQVERMGHARSLALTCTTAKGRKVPAETAASLIDLNGSPHVLAIIRDRTERRLFERELERLAYNDNLTGLPNRVLFNDRLERALVHARRTQHRGALLFIDLDNFKTINDSLGHAAGDSLLCTVGDRLRELLRETDTVARLGGDEFVILIEPEALSGPTATEHALKVAQKIGLRLKDPLPIDDQDIGVTASIGITVFPDDGDSVDELLRRADAAMYCAKSNGRNTISVYQPALEASASAKLRLGNELRHALEHDEFFLEYQPLVGIESLRQIGAEALVRWRHPDRGIVPPGEFIPYLEESGLILDVGIWILCQACRTWQRTLDANPDAGDMRLAVNISSQQFRSPLFIDSLLEILEDTGLDPACLELELTEHSLVRDLDDAQEKMRQLKEIGVSLSLDDFGTGYSSLSYIHKLPVDKVKIDRSFVQDIDNGDDRAGLVDTIITLGQKLGMVVVAEGVETQTQADYLCAQGCQVAQGFLYAAPGSEPLVSQASLDPNNSRNVA